MVSHEGVSEISKQIDVNFYFVMKLKSSGIAEIPYINSPEMRADVFTKELSDDIHADVCSALVRCMSNSLVLDLQRAN